MNLNKKEKSKKSKKIIIIIFFVLLLIGIFIIRGLNAKEKVHVSKPILKLENNSGVIYVGGLEKKSNIVSESNDLICKSSNDEFATCQIKNNKLVIYPGNQEGKGTITIIDNKNNISTDYKFKILNTEIKLKSTSGSDVKGNELTVAVTGKNYGTLTCSSSNTSIATCKIDDDKLVISSITKGTALITIKEGNGNKTSVYSIDVKDNIKNKVVNYSNKTNNTKNQKIETSIKLNKTSDTFYLGSGNITLSITGENMGDLTCNSTDENLATCKIIDKTLKVIPINEGNVKITVKESNGNKTATYSLNVKKSSLKLKSTSGTAYVGGDSTNVDIEGTNLGTLSCSSNNNEIATCNVVDNKLVINPIGRGNAVITLTESNGKLTANYNVTIKTAAVLRERPENVSDYDPFWENESNEGFAAENVRYITRGNIPNDYFYSWKVQKTGSIDITAYAVEDTEVGCYDITLVSEADEILAPENSKYLFANVGLYADDYDDDGNKKYKFDLSWLNTSNTTNMSYMFKNFAGEEESFVGFNLGDKFDTSKVTNMKGMFSYFGYMNAALTTLNLGDNFNTSNVTDMSYMFESALSAETSFKSLDLGDKFNTSKVTDMSYMFYNLGNSSKLDTIKLGDKFDTSKVENMEGMFMNLAANAKLKTLDLGDNFNTSNVTNMYGMFMSFCSNNADFNGLDLGNKFNTSKVEIMDHMFNSFGEISTKFTTLDLGDNFNTSSVTSMFYMFEGLGKKGLISLKLGDKFDVSNVTNLSYLFENVGSESTNFTTLDLGDNFNTINATNMSNMFSYIGSKSSVFKTLDLGDNFNTSNVTNMSNMFRGLGSNNLVSLDLGDKFNTTNVTNMSGMFRSVGEDSSGFKSLNLGNKFDTSKVNDMENMFNGVGKSSTNFINMDLGDKFDTSKVSNMYYMFNNFGYNSLETIDFGPKFIKIASLSKNYTFTGLGKSDGTTIWYIPNAIYENASKLKLLYNSATTINIVGTLVVKY